MTYLFCYQYKPLKNKLIEINPQLYHERNAIDNDVASYVIKEEDFIPEKIGGLIKLVSIEKQSEKSVKIGIRNEKAQICYFHVPRDNIQETAPVRKPQ